MKYLKLIIFTVIFAGLGSCENDDTITVNPEDNATLLEADISRIELDINNTTNPALTLYWSAAEYSEQTPPSYQVELSNDESFTGSVTSNTVVGTNSITFSVDELNTLAAGTGLPPFAWNTLYARVNSFLGATPGSVETVSNIISIDVYTYYNYFYKDHFLVGPASASDWNNNNNNPVMFRDATDANKYSYTGRFNSGPLKFLEMRGAWAPQYGEGDPGKLVYRPTEADDDPSAINDLENSDSGYYTFSINIDNLSFTIEPFDISSATPLSGLAISGSAIASETELVQYGIDGAVFDEFIWYIPSIHLVPGDFIFTANGSDQWGSDTLFSGIATPNGGNIPVDVEDNYEVWFNSLTGEYHLIPINISNS